MKGLHMAAYVLLWVGGLSLGYMGLTGENLLEMILGDVLGDAMNYLYVLIGAATIYVAATHMKECKVCSKK